MNGIAKLDNAHREMKSSSTKSRSSIKDKDKFKTALKNIKEKPVSGQEHPEPIPLAQLFSSSAALEKESAETMEQKPLEGIEEQKKRQHHRMLGEERAASSQTLRAREDLSYVYKTEAITKTETLLSDQVIDLFHDMVSHMTVMTAKDVQKTTIHITGSQFASSAFYGAKIIISEYSTAPRVFNIELVGSSEAALKFHAHLEDLKQAFETGPFSFQVNRLEATLSDAETSLFNRKERVSLDEEEQ